MKSSIRKIKTKFDSVNKYFNYGLIVFWVLIIGSVFIFKVDLFSNEPISFPSNEAVFGQNTNNIDFKNCKEEVEPKIVSESKFLATNTELGRYDLFLDTYTLGRDKNEIPALANLSFYESNHFHNCLNQSDSLIQFEYQDTKYHVPTKLLGYHLIINQDINNNRFLITYSPVSDSYSVLVNNSELNFGVSGRFIAGNMLMFDDQTDSLWAQLTGEALIGNRAGQQLDLVRSEIVQYIEIENCSNCLVTDFSTGFDFDYSKNPYKEIVLTAESFGLEAFADSKFELLDKISIVFSENSYSAYDDKILENRIITDEINSELFTIEFNNSNYPVAKTLGGNKLVIIDANYATIKEFFPNLEIKVEGG